MINRVTIQPHPLDRVSIVLSPLFLMIKPIINANTNKIINNSIVFISNYHSRDWLAALDSSLYIIKIVE